jgi:hypothetical protein
MLPRVRWGLQHHLIAMHVYSRLRGLMPHVLARRLAKVWERLVHPLLYRRFSGANPDSVSVPLYERRS